MRQVVVGDIHGKIGMLESLLSQWDQEIPLLFLGDFIDRGEDSRAVLTRVKSLVDAGKARCLMGNHEQMFLEWLDAPLEYYPRYQRNGGDTTINSLLGRSLDAPVDAIRDALLVEERCGDLVAFIRSLPYYLETEGNIFVHAGLDLNRDDWRATSAHDFVWIREPFHQGKNTTGKRIFFGHTPTFYLLGQKPGIKELWVTDDGKIGLDGGAVYGGVLHGLIVDEAGFSQGMLIEHDGGPVADD